MTPQPPPAVEIRVIDAEVLRVGPADRLIVKVPSPPVGEADHVSAHEFMGQLSEMLTSMGLDGRVLVIAADVELALVEAEAGA